MTMSTLGIVWRPARRRGARGWSLAGPCRRLGVVAAGVALSMVLGHALVPIYASAVVESQYARLVPLCSADGLMWVLLDADGAPPPSRGAGQGACHFCDGAATVFASSGVPASSVFAKGGLGAAEGERASLAASRLPPARP